MSGSPSQLLFDLVLFVLIAWRVATTAFVHDHVRAMGTFLITNQKQASEFFNELPSNFSSYLYFVFTSNHLLSSVVHPCSIL